MKHQPSPAIATWLLKLFCPSADYESVTGDLLEQYQTGRGRLWYWRQVLAVVFVALYDKVIRRPLIRGDGSPVGRGFAVGIVVAALSAALLSDIWPILVVGILGGVFAGILKFGLDNPRGTGSYRKARNSSDDSFTLLPQPPDPGSARTKTEPVYAFQKIRTDEERETSMGLHRGINSTSIAGEGFEGLPGLLLMIAFVFIFLGLFWPRNNDGWFGALFSSLKSARQLSTFWPAAAIEETRKACIKCCIG